MALTDVQIASKALVLLGQPPITTLQSDKRNNQAIAAILDITKQSFLSKTYWKFALREKPLPVLAVGSDFREDYQYQYQLPIDNIRAIGDTKWRATFQIAGNELYSDANDFVLLYVANVDISFYPAYAADALAYQLAADAAIAITDDSQRKNESMVLAQQSLSVAMGIDSTTQSNWDLGLERIFQAFPTARF